MNTIAIAERDLYLALQELSQHYPIANEWLTRLPKSLATIKDKNRYAHAPAYLGAVENLPQILPTHNRRVTLNTDAIHVHLDWTDGEYKQSMALLKQLMPWRKGPFCLGQETQGTDNLDKQIYLNTEWRSDWKWQRVAPHLSDLRNRRVLDVGGGSGYHGWRMLAGNQNVGKENQSEDKSEMNGALQVFIVDPSCLFYHQFMAIRHFITSHAGTCAGTCDAPSAPLYPIHYIPVGLEALPENSQLFDTVFSMGVLYHRASPFEHLNRLKGQLVKGGEVVLETLVIEGDSQSVLVPIDRYAQMNNVYFLPSVDALKLWLEKVGFINVRCVDINTTSTKEQRATEWMNYHSLADYLDKDDPSKTLEGYPAPMRAVMIAKKP